MPGAPTTWPKADIWSVGAIAAYLWFRETPSWLGNRPPGQQQDCQLFSTPAEVASFVQERSMADPGQPERRWKVALWRQEVARCAQGYTAPEEGDRADQGLAAAERAAAALGEPPAGLLDLLGGCLVADPAQRKTAKELLALPWFEGKRAQVLARAQARRAANPPASPTAAGAAGAAAAPTPPSSTSWGTALEALVEEWRRA